MAEKGVSLDPFQNIVEVGWSPKGCGLVAQVGRSITFGAHWEVQVWVDEAPTMSGGGFQGPDAPGLKEWEVGNKEEQRNLAYQLEPMQIIVDGHNSGNLAVVFNFQRIRRNLKKYPDEVSVDIFLKTTQIPHDNVSQWHFGVDTFELDEKGVPPLMETFYEPDDPDAMVGGDTQDAAAPMRIPPPEKLLKSARLFLPHSDQWGGVFVQGTETIICNTKTGKLTKFPSPTSLLTVKGRS